MKNYIKVNLIVMLLLLVSAQNIFAGGGRRNGTGGASELLIPVGTRGMAMGNANSAVSSGIEALFWNPAGLSRSNYTAEATFSHMTYIADIGLNYGAVSANFTDFGTITLSIKSLSIGDIDVTTTSDPDGTGQKFSPSYITAGLSYSRALSDRISVGFTGNLVMEELGQVSAQGVAFNVGVLYQNLANVNGLNFGVVMKNIGPQMKFDGPGLYTQATAPDLTRPSQYYKIDAAGFELPSTLEFGLGYRAVFTEENVVQISSTFQNSNFSGDEYRIGAEYVFNDLIALRGGYTYVPNSEEATYIYGLTAGVGINYDVTGTNVKIDYAFRDVDFFEANHIFSLSVGF